jgi:septal ring factor EnvC (AmiA/AmiB activator)
VFEVKREFSIQIEELKQKLAEKQEENDYLNEKVATMETQNRELRLSKDPKAELKKFESEVAFLRQQLAEY